MTSCFLCDCSYKFTVDGDRYNIAYIKGVDTGTVPKHMKQLPIMVGSSGTDVDDQQHKNNKKQNYVSYRVKRVEFSCSFSGIHGSDDRIKLHDYVLIFKVPFREPVFDYYFGVLNNFMLYSEPECVLGYKILQFREGNEAANRYPRQFNININKPFVVGPNDYVGVVYVLGIQTYNDFYVDASAKVWFDLA